MLVSYARLILPARFAVESRLSSETGECSTADEWFFTISPIVGAAVVRLSRHNATALGFKVSGSALPAYNPASGAPSVNCTEEQIEGQGLNGIPVG